MFEASPDDDLFTAHCTPTSSILSAGGRFLGFFVNNTFTKFWNVCDLSQKQKRHG